MLYPVEMSEEELIRTIVQDKRLATKYLYDRYKGHILGMLMKILQDDALADRALAEIYILAYRKLHLYDPRRQSIFMWLQVIARNHANQIAGNAGIEVSGYDVISQRHQLFLDMFYLKGWKRKEVAIYFGIPVSDVARHLRMAILELRDQMEGLNSAVLPGPVE